jgi:hypothetical protein
MPLFKAAFGLPCFLGRNKQAPRSGASVALLVVVPVVQSLQGFLFFLFLVVLLP